MVYPLLITVQALVADTVVTIESRDSVALAADIAVLVAAAAVAILALVVVPLLLEWRRTLVELRGSVRQSLGPVSDRARSISDNVQFITQALRTDVERLNASVQALTARLHQASDHMEERIEEFNALMEVVQEEAEDIFLDTAATVRGVREGARTLGRRTPESTPVPPADPDEGRDRELPPAEVEDDSALPAGER